jgi:hypothetical protein
VHLGCTAKRRNLDPHRAFGAGRVADGGLFARALIALRLRFLAVAVRSSVSA